MVMHVRSCAFGTARLQDCGERALWHCVCREDTCQTPNVIFATGLKPLGSDAFLVVYGGGDTDMAAIKIQVDVKRQ